MTSKREKLLEALSDETATHARAILVAEDAVRKRMAELSYISFLQNLILSLITDVSDTDKD